VRSALDRLGPFVALVVLSGAVALASPNFLTIENLFAVGVQTAVVAIIAVGETLVIIGGHIDLSVGSVLALSGVLAALLMAGGLDPWLASLCGVAAGTACGLMNGLLTTRIRMPSFVVTLGVMGIARGSALTLSGARNIFGLPPSFKVLAAGGILGLPLPIIIVAAVAAAAHILLARSSFGRAAYAIGGNLEAARLSGINVGGIVTGLFVICGFLSGLAGIVLTSRLTIGQPTAAQGYELDAIAAAVIGGASLMGGQGSISGAIVGALIMAVLRNACDLLNVPIYWQQIAIGAVIIAAVAYDHLRRPSG